MNDPIIACKPNYEKGTFTCSGKTVSFQSDPEKAIQFWQEILAEDIKADKQLKDYRILKFFKGLTQEQRDEMAKKILEKFEIQLNYPPGKINLAHEKDYLGIPLNHYSPRHLLVLLYSITGRKEKELTDTDKKKTSDDTKIPDTHFRNLLENSLRKTVAEGKSISIGKGGQKITFEFEEGIKLQKGDSIKLYRIYNLVTELNTLIPSKPVKKMGIIKSREFPYGHKLLEAGEYDYYRHKIDVSLDISFLEITAHEMGHAIFRVLLGGEGEEYSDATKDKAWQKVYYLSLGFKNFEIVDDSSYCGEMDLYGHPFDNASELFASSIMVYWLYPDKFIENILNTDTSEETRKLGKLIFLYLRDKIFGGKVFSKSDPFKFEFFESFKIEDDEIIISFINALDDKHLNSVEVVPRVIGKLKDERLIPHLIAALQQTESFDLRVGAARAIAYLGIRNERVVDLLNKVHKASQDTQSSDLRIATARALAELGVSIEPLLKALSDRIFYVRFGAAIAISKLKTEERKLFIEPLTKRLNDSDPVVRMFAASALGKIGDRTVIPALNKVVDEDSDDRNREAARGAIHEIKKRDFLKFGRKQMIKDKEDIEFLLKVLKDRNPEIRRLAALSIGKSGIKDERFVEALIEALSDSNADVRFIAALSIGEIGIKDERFIEALIKALGDSNADVRRAAAIVLGIIGNKKAILAIEKLLDTEENKQVREAARKAIEEIEKREG